MGNIVRFESGETNSYTFPDTIQNIRDNFTEVLGRVQRLPQSDGGFDEFGIQKAPSAVGTVQFDFFLDSSTRAGMDALRQTLTAITAWGQGRLYKQPSNPASDEVWCFARVNNITLPEDHAGQSDFWQKVQITFQVSEPYWIGTGNLALWGASTWGNFTWGGSAGEAVSGLTTSFTVTYAGDADTYPAISISCGGAQTISTVTIQRVVDGDVVDEVSYNAAIGNSESVVIDCRRLMVTHDGVSAYSDFDALRGDWFRLVAGSNAITVLLGSSGDAGTVKIAYYERNFK